MSLVSFTYVTVLIIVSCILLRLRSSFRFPLPQMQCLQINVSRVQLLSEPGRKTSKVTPVAVQLLSECQVCLQSHLCVPASDAHSLGEWCHSVQYLDVFQNQLTCKYELVLSW